jgi:hypothetical protein
MNRWSLLAGFLIEISKEAHFFDLNRTFWDSYVCSGRQGLEATSCIRCGAELPVPETREVDRVLIVPATAE